MRINKVCLISSARIPGNNSLAENYNTLSMGLIVDYTTGVVCDCSFTFISPVIENFVRELLVGRNLHKETTKEIMKEVENLFIAPTRKAVGVLIRENITKYYQWRKDNDMNCDFLQKSTEKFGK